MKKIEMPCHICCRLSPIRKVWYKQSLKGANQRHLPWSKATANWSTSDSALNKKYPREDWTNILKCSEWYPPRPRVNNRLAYHHLESFDSDSHIELLARCTYFVLIKWIEILRIGQYAARVCWCFLTTNNRWIIYMYILWMNNRWI